MTTYAGEWGTEALIGADGDPAPSEQVTVYIRGTATLATLYTDRTKANTTANPTTADARGNLKIHADPGRYTGVSESGVTFDITIHRDLDEVTFGLNASSPVDGVEGQLVITPDGDNTNGIVIKAADDDWGVDGETAGGGDEDYGTGQFIVFLRDTPDDGDPETSDTLVFRVDRTGGLGMTGAMHVATGLRQHDGYAPTQAVWIDAQQDMVGLVITSPPAPYSAAPLLVVDRDTVSALLTVLAGGLGVLVKTALTVDNGLSTKATLGSLAGLPGVFFGNSSDAYIRRSAANVLAANSTIIANDGTTTRVAIGNTFTLPGIAFGQTGDTLIFRSAAGVLSTAANGVFKTGQNVTASRPSASTVGAGAQFYDTTLQKPIWSNGTVWRDAAGNTV